MGSYVNSDEWAEAYIRVNEENGCMDESRPDFLAAYEFRDELVGDKAERYWSGILAVVQIIMLHSLLVQTGIILKRVAIFPNSREKVTPVEKQPPSS